MLVALLAVSASLPVFGEEGFAVCDETADIDYSAYAGTTLNVYNWGEYISDGSEGTVNLVREFEKLTGIKVNYDFFDSNESMYAKLKSGASAYDIVIPSDYMVQRLNEEGLLLPLDFSNIPNYKYIDEKYKGLYFDAENKYTVPYTVGLLGIIYNSAEIEGEPDSWSLMFDDNYAGQILLINNPRDAFGIAQFALGLDVNSDNKDEWRQALDKLILQKPLIQGKVMDEVFNKMESGEAAVAAYYAGDFLTMYGNNSDLAFYYPKEGTNIFVDAMCIPSCAQNKGAAELFINFMLDPNVAVENSLYICYASPNTEVTKSEYYIEEMEALHPDAMSILYPEEGEYTGYYYHNLSPEMLAYENELWEELNSQGDVGNSVYITCLVILAFIAVWFVVRAIKKSRINYD